MPNPLHQLLRQLLPQSDSERQHPARGRQKQHLRALTGAPRLCASSLASWTAASPAGQQLQLAQDLWLRDVAGEAGDNCGGSQGVGSSGGGGGGGGGGQASPTTSAAARLPAVQLGFPCVLRPAVSPKGLDLRLQLFSLQVGELWDPPPSSSNSVSSRTGWQQRVCSVPAPPQQKLPPLLRVLDKAACLLAARLLFPEAAAPTLRLLAAAHCASAAAQATSLLLSPDARAAAGASLRSLRRQVPVVDAAAAGTRQLRRVVRQYGEPAAVLLVVAALWAYLHPTSAELGQCIAGLLPVLAGYNQTAKQCATLGLSGNASEELWRQRHKWAARRTAAFLTDVPDVPPLAGVVSAWEALNICIGASVGGTHFGAIFGGLDGGGGLQLSGSVGRRSQRSQRAGRATLAVAPGHVAAVPAAPLREEVYSSGSSSSEAWEESSQEELLLEPPPQQQQQGGQQRVRRLPLAAVPAGPAAEAVACGGRGSGVLDSPSELCASPLTQVMLRQQQQQGQQQQQASADSSSQLWGDGGSSNSGQQQQRVPRLLSADEAALRQAAAATAAAAPDFMHPVGWAAARQAAGGAGGGARGAAGSGSTTSSSSSIGTSSSHSFLLPGRRYSSSEASSDAGAAATAAAAEERYFSPPTSLLQLPPGIGPAAASAQQQRQLQLLPAAATASRAAPAAGVQQQQQGAAGVAVTEGDAAGPEAVPPPLPLFGRGDHDTEATRKLTMSQRAQLAVRAVQLMALFAPFLFLGTVMLLLASRLEAAAVRRQPQQQQLAQAPQEPAARAAAAVPSPAASRLRVAAFKLLLGACRRSGAAFIKWGQWSSTREDMFPLDFCRVLSELHDRAPTHTPQQSRAIVEAAFGQTLERLFLSFEPRALASGSIAQVHRARLLFDGEVREVVVKVRHPGVEMCIWQDFQLLRPLADLTKRIRSLRSLNLSDSVSQFSHTMTAQTDLRVEAAHLLRFYNNFGAVGSSVRVPQPLDGYCTEDVLVETYEPGQSVAHFIHHPHPQNTQIVALGVDTYLKMLLQDNFVHTDLHPGNILVRAAGGTSANGGHAETGGDGGSGMAALAAAAANGGSSGSGGGREQQAQLQLILLDFGLAEELTPPVRRHFISFLHMVAKGDAAGASRHLLRWSSNQRCPDRVAFMADMVELFREQCNIHAEDGIDLDAVMKAVLHLARRHEVSIDSNYAALVIGVCVIVGFATSLDRRVNLMDAATPCFLYYALTGRVSGRLYM